ncbi:hypothetical protein [Lacticaseibacillus absianus]|uniref:hypothetical protein n=1 Tax=Lacticaseibacillus absianus TaxID=2729623 RepID=UPI0015C82E95|nr:hypothetical protein [Lacticaseibacillus absianus]
MKKSLLLLTILLLSGCHALAPAMRQTPTAHHVSPSSTTTHVSRQSRAPHAPNTTAAVDDLVGHYFVNQADHNEVLQFSADTTGYIFDIQRREPGADFTSAAEGIFNATLTTSGSTYTLSGTAQPNAAGSTLQFEKLSATKIRQLPDGPTFKRVRNDDRRTIQ